MKVTGWGALLMLRWVDFRVLTPTTSSLLENLCFGGNVIIHYLIFYKVTSCLLELNQ